MPDIRFAYSVASVRLDDLFVLVLSLISCVLAAKGKARVSTSGIVVASLVLLVAGAQFLHTIYAGREYSTYLLVRNLMVFGVVIFLSIHLSDRSNFKAFLGGLGVAAVMFVAQFFNSLSLALLTGSPFYVVKSLIGFQSLNANAIGEMAFLFLSALGVGRAIFCFEKRKVALGMLALVMVIVLSFNRAAFIGVLVVCFVLGARYFRIRNILAFCTGASLVVLSFQALFPDYAGLVSEALSFNPATGANTGSRFHVWGLAVEKIVEAPIMGYGFASEFHLFDPLKHFGSSHNFVLSLALEHGILVAGLVLSSLTYVLYKLGMSDRRLAERNRPSILVALFLGLLALNMFHSSLYGSKYAVLTLVVLMYGGFHAVHALDARGVER